MFFCVYPGKDEKVIFDVRMSRITFSTLPGNTRSFILGEKHFVTNGVHQYCHSGLTLVD